MCVCVKEREILIATNTSHAGFLVQGYLAHKKTPTPLGPLQGPGHGPTVESQGAAVSYERGTPVTCVCVCVCGIEGGALITTNTLHAGFLIQTRLLWSGKELGLSFLGASLPWGPLSWTSLLEGSLPWGPLSGTSLLWGFGLSRGSLLGIPGRSDLASLRR